MENYKMCCRLCLDSEGNLQSLFQEGTLNELQQKISKNLGVEILADDKLTTMICSNCIEKVNNWQIFKQTCTENQSKLEQWFNATSAAGKPQTNNDQSINNDIQIKEEPIENMTIPPPEVILTNGDAPIMKNEPIEEEFNDLPPPLTPQRDESEEVEVVAYSENGAIDTSLTDQLHQESSQDSEVSSDPRRCGTCSKLLSSITNRKKHEKVVHGIRSRNTFPTAGGSTDSDLGLLKNSSKKPLKQRSCPDCGKQFLHENTLRQHRRIHMKIKLLFDPDAEDRKSLESLPQVVLICELCYCIFLSKEDLKHHKFTKHGENTSELSTKVAIDEDKVTNEQELMRQFHKKCDYCPLNFRSPTKYFEHIEIHIRKKKRDALEATKNKKPSQQKRKKLGNAFGESYQTCRVCYKAFNNKSELRTHFKSHVKTNKTVSKPNNNKKKQLPKEKLYCGHCTAICSNSVQLSKHMQCKHKDQNIENIFYCKPCKKSFPRISALHCHQVWKHKEGMNQTLDKRKNSESKPQEPVVKQKLEKPAIKKVLEKKNGNQKIETKPGRQSLRIKREGNVKRDKDVTKKIHKETDKLKDDKITVKDKEISKKEDSFIFKCTTCGVECRNQIALQVHLLEKHNTSLTAKQKEKPATIPYRCNFCNLNFTVQSAYEDHRRFHSLVEQNKHTYACKICTASFSKLENLNLHLENFHTKLNCHQCDKEFETPASLNIHIAVAHRKQKAVAADSASSTHIEHFHSQLQPQMFKCQECDSVFEKVGSLNIHLVVVHEKQNMITDKNKTAVAVPTLIKKFVCTICGLGFDNTRKLEFHTEVAHSL